ncbi:MAG: hypothetical protein Q9P14_17925 [candidate division KSB1 bacterium]|nr:hypothetical protein [candidate division KSB1 bacterium]
MKRFLLPGLILTLLVSGSVLAQKPDTIRVGIRTVNLALDGEGKIIALSEGRDSNFDGELQADNGEVPGALFRIDPDTRQVLVRREFDGFLSNLAVHGDTGYVVQRQPLRLSSFNTRTLATIADTLIMADPNKGVQFYEVSVDPQTGWMYVGTGGFDKPGEVLVFGPDGTLMHRMTAGFGASDVLFADPLDGYGGRVAFVINEGAFGKNNASMSYFRYQPKLFAHTAGRPLGNTANSMKAFGDGRLFIVLNGSHRIEVVDANSFQPLGTINVGTSGYNGPRQVAFLPNDSTGVVSTFNNDLRFFDMATYKITDSLAVGQKPEALIVNDSFLFVANGGFTGFSEDSTVFIIDWKKRTIIDTLVTGIRTTQLLKPSPGMIIAISEGRDKNFDGVLQANAGEVPGRITMIDENTGNVVSQMSLTGFAGVGAVAWYNLGQGPVTHLYLVQMDPLRISRFEVGEDSIWIDKDTMLAITPETGGKVYHLSVWDDHNPPLLMVSTGFGSNELMFVDVLSGQILHRFSMGIGAKDVAFSEGPVPGTTRFYVLNEGAFGGDNASLSLLDLGRKFSNPLPVKNWGIPLMAASSPTAESMSRSTAVTRLKFWTYFHNPTAGRFRWAPAAIMVHARWSSSPVVRDW